jgi:5'-methylthioadenosine phosphorylase
MNKTAIIGGSGFKNFKKKGVVFLQRHAPLNSKYLAKDGKNKPPHKINHKKNMLSLKKRGVNTIIGICSVGSLKLKIKPGSIVVPHDYINIKNIQTYHDLKVKHITPSLDKVLRKKIIDAAQKNHLPIIKKGIYIQTIGPRLETKAEINMIKKFADIVGMTMGTEATLAQELGIKYAAICSVDNYANGIIKKPLSFKTIKKEQAKNRKKIMKLLDAILR